MSAPHCIACGSLLIATSANGIYEHAGKSCGVRLLDRGGDSLDLSYEVLDDDSIAERIYARAVNRRTEPCDVYIGRGSPFGNPFAAGGSEFAHTIPVASREEAIKRYANWLTTDEQIEGWVKPSRDQIAALRGQRLGCYCAPQPCHGDVLADLAENGFPSPAAPPAPPTALVLASADEPEASPFPLPRALTIAPVKKSKDFFVPFDEGGYPWTLFDAAVVEIFAEAKLQRPGGASGGLGWSSFSTFQRCPFLWQQQQLRGDRVSTYVNESPALVIGSAVHLFLALHYEAMRGYPLDAKTLRDRLLERNCNPEYIAEAWRLYDLYSIYYANEPIEVLAVEQLAFDPKTGESCRYDMIARFTKAYQSFAPGTYIFEHKTVPRLDDTALTGWRGDGEIIGQWMLWKRLKYDKKYGPLQGTVMNLLPKTKEPSFTRVAVNVMPWQLRAHARDLQQWLALRNLFISLGSFPRSRANCINRWGKCQLWEHCADAEKDV